MLRSSLVLLCLSELAFSSPFVKTPTSNEKILTERAIAETLNLRPSKRFSTRISTNVGVDVSADVVGHEHWKQLQKTLAEKTQIGNFMKKDQGVDRRSNDGSVCSVVHLTERSRHITSPGWGISKYGNDLRCVWHIEIPHNNGIRVFFDDGYLEYESKCLYDSIKIDWTPVGGDSPIKEEVLCGNLKNERFNFGPGTLSLKLTTDGDVGKDGFSLYYETGVSPGEDNPCSKEGIMLSKPTGTVQTPGFNGERLYFNNLECQWKIIAPTNKAVTLTFEHVDIEDGDGSSCDWDSLRVFDGSPGDNEIAVVCGKSIPNGVTSSSNEITLKFHSDETESYTGFKISYQVVDNNANRHNKPTAGNDACSSYGITLTDSQGHISPPLDSAGKYFNDAHCFWTIELPDKSSMLELNWENIETESGSGCQYDSITVISGENDPYPRKYCGIMDSFYTIIQSHTAIIKLDSDHSVAGRGFSLNYKALSFDELLGKTLNEDCGNPAIHPEDTRIVNGSEAKQHSYPWQVSLLFNGRPDCGGAILSKKWILTATHCVEGESSDILKVVASEHLVNKVEGTEQILDVLDIYMHPQYNQPTSMSHDVALLRLDGEIQYTARVSPICLPLRDLPVDYTCIVAGWGDTRGTGDDNRLNRIEVPLMNNDLCSQDDWYGNEISDDMLCAGFAAGGKDSCQGDSGGPLFCKTSGGYYVQEAVVSWGYGCGIPKRPGVYARVPPILDWIIATTGGEITIK